MSRFVPTDNYEQTPQIRVSEYLRKTLNNTEYTQFLSDLEAYRDTLRRAIRDRGLSLNDPSVKKEYDDKIKSFHWDKAADVYYRNQRMQTRGNTFNPDIDPKQYSNEELQNLIAAKGYIEHQIFMARFNEFKQMLTQQYPNLNLMGRDVYSRQIAQDYKNDLHTFIYDYARQLYGY